MKIEKNLSVASAADGEAMSGHDAFEDAGAAAIGGWDGDQPTDTTEEEIAACEGDADRTDDGAAPEGEDEDEAAPRGVGAVSANVFPIDRLRDEDRLRPLPPKASEVSTFFDKPHPANPYNTRRFRDVVCWAATTFPVELAEAMRVLREGKFGRHGAGFLDIFEYNCVTLAAGWAYQKAGLRVVDGHALTALGRATGKLGAKFPRGTGWPSEASVDPEKLIARYTGDGTYPPGKRGQDGFPYASRRQPRSICAATGSGIAVMDFDGETGLRWASENQHILPKTAAVRTGSGGRHLYYRVPVDALITNSASAIAQGVDVRGEGGQAMLPPSIHPSGNFYGWEPGLSVNEVGIADAPQELIDLMLAASKKGKSSTKSKARAALRKVAGAGRDQFSDQDRPQGFDEWLEAIGDHEGGRGFDNPIYVAAMSYLGQLDGEPDDGDFLDLKALLRDRILDADCKDDRAETRYATDGYLEHRIAQAWDFIEQSDADADDKDEEDEPSPNAEPGAALPAKTDPLELAKEITSDSSESDVRRFFKRLVKHGVDEMVRGKVIADIVKRTPLGKRQLEGWWKTVVEDRARAIAKKEGKSLILPAETGADEMVNKTIEALRTANEGFPVLFHREIGLAKIEFDARGVARIVNLDSRDGLAHTINELGIFGKNSGHGDNVKIIPDFAPDAVVQHVWNTAPQKYALPLYGLPTAPFYDAQGELVFENGYHPGSKMFLAMPEGAMLERVSAVWVPTREEVDDAVMMLAELFADFPLDGMTRKDLMDRLEQGQETPSFCALLAFVLLPFMREMIAGPTPGHFFTKPAPGTGASLLIEVATTIALGEGAPAVDLPPNGEEVGKTLTSLIASGMPFANFDNVSHSMDSGALASAMTKRRHLARVLGTPKLVDVPVRTIWSFSGNNATMTGELLRRCIPIQLDARLPDPTKGRNFALDDIAGYAREHRWELVSACLTLIQNWIVAGRKPWSGRPLSSFEDWSRAIGGVLEASSLPGFMANVDGWKDAARDGREEDANRLLRELSDLPDGTIFRAKGTTLPRGGAEGAPVVSLIDRLNASNDTDEGAIRLDGGGYKEVIVADEPRVVYSSPRHIAKVFGTLARVPHRFVVVAEDGTESDVFLNLEEKTDRKNGGTYWLKVPGADPDPDHPGGE